MSVTKPFLKPLALTLGSLAVAGLLVSMPSDVRAQMKSHKSVSIITGSTTGTWFPSGAALAELVNRHYDGQPMSTVPGAGGVSNPDAVGLGKADFGISLGPFLKAAMEGNPELYKRAYPNLMGIGAGPATAQHLVMDADMSIETLKEAAAKKMPLRVGSGVKGSANRFSFEVLLDYYGLSFDMFVSYGGTVAKVGSTGAADGYKNRQLDIVNIFIAHPNAKIADMMRSRPSKLVSIPDDARAALIKKWGFLDETVPANSYEGQSSEVKTLALPLVVFTTKEMDEEIVYNLTKSWAENKARMDQIGGSWKPWNPEKMAGGTGVPLHPGALRFYKEKGWM